MKGTQKKLYQANIFGINLIILFSILTACNQSKIKEKALAFFLETDSSTDDPDDLCYEEMDDYFLFKNCQFESFEVAIQAPEITKNEPKGIFLFGLKDASNFKGLGQIISKLNKKNEEKVDRIDWKNDNLVSIILTKKNEINHGIEYHYSRNLKMRWILEGRGTKF